MARRTAAGRRSAGILLFRRTGDQIEVFLGHLGGPFWVRKDAGAWSLPKGEYLDGEDPFLAARREFEEETGSPAPDVEYRELPAVRLSSGKVITAWVGESDFDETCAVSNSFELEWPRGSGRLQAFPELDRFGWFDVGTARTKVSAAQVSLLDALDALG